MYAIISDGAHQYRVEEGQVLEVQRKDLPEDTKTYEFERVLLVGDIDEGLKIGQPVVEGAKVTATVLGEIKGLAVHSLWIYAIVWTINAPVHVLATVAIAIDRHRVLAGVVIADLILNMAISLALAASGFHSCFALSLQYRSRC